MSATESKLRVLIVDDHPIFRHGLRQLVEAHQGFHVAGEAGDGETALAQIGALKPDIMIVDLSLPKLSGLDLVRKTRAARPSTACLVLTMNDSESTFNAVMDAGAQGYML